MLVTLVGCGRAEAPPPQIGHPPLVFVEYKSDDREAVLQRRWQGMPWATACKSPCSRELRPDFEYRVAGEGITPSRTFFLSGPSNITARAGSLEAKRVGVVAVSIGVPLLIVGSFLGLIALKDERLGPDGGYAGPSSTFAFIGAGFGGVLTISGTYMLATNFTTVDVRDRGPIAKLTLQF